MDYPEFKRHVGKAGLSINQFAALIGINAASVSNYAKKPEVPPAYAVIAVTLGEMADRKIDFLALLARFGVGPREEAKVTHLDQYRERSKSKKKE